MVINIIIMIIILNLYFSNCQTAVSVTIYLYKQNSCAIAKMTARYKSGSNEPLWRYGYSKLSNMAAIWI